MLFPTVCHGPTLDLVIVIGRRVESSNSKMPPVQKASSALGGRTVARFSRNCEEDKFAHATRCVLSCECHVLDLHLDRFCSFGSDRLFHMVG